MEPFLLLSAIAAAALLAAVALRRAGQRDRRARRDLLADCAGLLEHARMALDEAGYGVLRGRRNGREAALRPFADTLVLKRLPQLWLAATVRDVAGEGPSIEVMRRPSGAEFYAVGAMFARRFATPPSWPADTEIRGGADAGPLLAALEPALAGAFENPRLKSVLVSPSGARVVLQAAEGERGAYLIFRDSRFAARRIAVADAETALAVAEIAAAARPNRTDARHGPEQAAA